MDEDEILDKLPPKLRRQVAEAMWDDHETEVTEYKEWSAWQHLGWAMLALLLLVWNIIGLALVLGSFMLLIGLVFWWAVIPGYVAVFAMPLTWVLKRWIVDPRVPKQYTVTEPPADPDYPGDADEVS